MGPRRRHFVGGGAGEHLSQHFEAGQLDRSTITWEQLNDVMQNSGLGALTTDAARRQQLQSLRMTPTNGVYRVPEHLVHMSNLFSACRHPVDDVTKVMWAQNSLPSTLADVLRQPPGAVGAAAGEWTDWEAYKLHAARHGPAWAESDPGRAAAAQHAMRGLLRGGGRRGGRAGAKARGGTAAAPAPARRSSGGGDAKGVAAATDRQSGSKRIYRRRVLGVRRDGLHWQGGLRHRRVQEAP